MHGRVVFTIRTTKIMLAYVRTGVVIQPIYHFCVFRPRFTGRHKAVVWPSRAELIREYDFAVRYELSIEPLFKF